MAQPDTQPPQVRDTGLTVLFDKTTPGSQNVDIVFVHGLNGKAKKTWTHANGFFWPWELRKELTKARVMMFGYDAGMGSEVTENLIRIKGIASSLNGALANKRITTEELSRPVIFIGHSLGGLVAKAAAVEASKATTSGANDLDKLYASMRGFMFFGTPHAGSTVFNMMRVKVLQKMAKAAFAEIPPKLESALQSGSDEVLDLSEDFRKISLFVEMKLLVASFYEQRSTFGLGSRVVDEFATTIAYAKASDPMPINADHMNMIKFKDDNDGEYDMVKGLLLRWETRLTEQGLPLAQHPPMRFPQVTGHPQGFPLGLVQIFVLDHQLSYLESLPAALRKQVQLPDDLTQTLSFLSGITQIGTSVDERDASDSATIYYETLETADGDEKDFPDTLNRALIQEIDDQSTATAPQSSDAEPIYNSEEPPTTKLNQSPPDMPRRNSSSTLSKLTLSGRASILCFDGGGVRCLSSLYILQEIMKQLSVELEQPGLRPCDVFDMIGGSSMGGVFAIMLGHLRMTVDATVDFCLTTWPHIFSTRFQRGMAVLTGRSRYRSKPLILALQHLTEAMTGSKDALFWADDDSRCKTFVALLEVRTDMETTRVIRNYNPTDRASASIDSLGSYYASAKYPIVDVMRACIAAPTYFEPVPLGGEMCIDGSPMVSNPSLFALDEASFLWDIHADDIGTFVSLGCSAPSMPRSENRLLPQLSLIKAMIATAIGSEKEHERISRAFQEAANPRAYYRFNAGQSLGSIAFDDVPMLDEIKRITQHYNRSQPQQPQIYSCVQSLINRYIGIWINNPLARALPVRSLRIGNALRARERNIMEQIVEHDRQGDILRRDHSEVSSLLAQWETWQEAVQQEDAVDFDQKE